MRVGMTMTEAGAALGMPLTPAEAAGEWIDVRPSPGLAGVMFMMVDGAIARVDASAGDVVTEEGVRVGDSHASLPDVPVITGGRAILTRGSTDATVCARCR